MLFPSQMILKFKSFFVKKSIKNVNSGWKLMLQEGLLKEEVRLKVIQVSFKLILCFCFVLFRLKKKMISFFSHVVTRWRRRDFPLFRLNLHSRSYHCFERKKLIKMMITISRADLLKVSSQPWHRDRIQRMTGADHQPLEKPELFGDSKWIF